MGDFQYIGYGVYNLAEASRLTKISRGRIRRWTRGYTYRDRKGTQHALPPVIGVTDDGGDQVLRFADLIEVRFLEAFRNRGVSWKTLRIAAQRAAEFLDHSHPFSTQKFRTDGRSILADLEGGSDHVLLDILSDQYAFEDVLTPFLYEGLEYTEYDEPSCWWPLGKDRTVLIDPVRGFGAPICAPSGVPTDVLYSTFEAEGDIAAVSWWYSVSEQEVEDAVEFEKRLAA